MRARRHVLQRLVNRTHIFSTPIASQWEDAARENLEAELGATERKLRSLQVEIPEVEEEPHYLQDRARDTVLAEKSSGESKVLRISRAQKVKCLEDDQEGTGIAADTTDTPPPSSHPTSPPPPSVHPTSLGGRERPSDVADAHETSSTRSTVADTSTLETVADFIENRQSRSRRQK